MKLNESVGKIWKVNSRGSFGYFERSRTDCKQMSESHTTKGIILTENTSRIVCIDMLMLRLMLHIVSYWNIVVTSDLESGSGISCSASALLYSRA
jgi:hypothetical protein